MKRSFLIPLALALVLLLTACGGAAPETAQAAPASARQCSVRYLNDRPQLDALLQELAAAYTAQTGTPVTVLTPASGTYADTLRAELTGSQPPTVFSLSTSRDLSRWDAWTLDLTDSALAAQLSTEAFNLHNEDGALKAIGSSYAAFGIIVNTDLLAQAGYTLADITDFETLKAVTQDITARSSALGFSAFTPAGLHRSSAWRFSRHMAALPLHYEGVTAAVPTVTGEKLDLYRSLWDLMLHNSAADPAALAAITQEEVTAAFTQGRAVFYPNGSWEYAALLDAGMTETQLAMIPLYCGAEGEQSAALSTGTHSHWAINVKAAPADRQAALDFLAWLVTDPEAAAAYAGAVDAVPFRNAPPSTNKFLLDGAELTASGKKATPWSFQHAPNPEAWSATVATALTAYAADPADAAWNQLVGAFVDGWAYEHSMING